MLGSMRFQLPLRAAEEPAEVWRRFSNERVRHLIPQPTSRECLSQRAAHKRISLPRCLQDADAPEPTRYEAALVSSTEAFAAVPLVVTTDGMAVCTRALKGKSGAELQIHVREVGSEAALWCSSPLNSLEVGHASARFGRLGSTALTATGDAPAGEASFACEWRLQRTLPPVSRYRTRPLAVGYSAPNDRDAFEHRLDEWRLELTENRATRLLGVQPEWTRPWRPPYPAHHLLGNPIIRRQHAAYIAAQADFAVTLRAQAVDVQLEALRSRLPGCQTAEQAVRALEAIRAFLETGNNLPLINAPKLLRQVRNLRLPFERLVRNVWQEGPEVLYDRTKASLTRLLQKEVGGRKAVAAAAARGPALPPPHDTLDGQDTSPMLLAEMKGLRTKGRQTYGPAGTPLTRAGLLTFYGEDTEQRLAAKAHFADRDD